MHFDLKNNIKIKTYIFNSIVAIIALQVVFLVLNNIKKISNL